MLEVTILKGKHDTEDDAKKLLPYIKQCDVYAPESALLLRSEAEKREDVFEKVLAQDLNRNELNVLLEKMEIKSSYHYHYPKYNRKQNEYLYREKKPLWYVERRTSDESAKGWEMRNNADVILKDAFITFLGGNIEGYLQLFRKRLLLQEELRELRDAHIAVTLASAEDAIRARYFRLAKKEKISFCVSLGAIHRVEDLYLPVQIVSLLDAPTNAMERLDHIRIQKVPPQEIDPQVILAVAATQILRFPEEEVEQLSFDELVERIKKIIRE